MKARRWTRCFSCRRRIQLAPGVPDADLYNCDDCAFPVGVMDGLDANRVRGLRAVMRTRNRNRVGR